MFIISISACAQNNIVGKGNLQLTSKKKDNLGWLRNAHAELFLNFPGGKSNKL